MQSNPSGTPTALDGYTFPPYMEKLPYPPQRLEILDPDNSIIGMAFGGDYIGVSGGSDPLQIRQDTGMINQALVGRMIQFMEDYSIPAWVRCIHCQSPNLFQNFECVKCGAPLSKEDEIK